MTSGAPNGIWSMFRAINWVHCDGIPGNDCEYVRTKVKTGWRLFWTPMNELLRMSSFLDTINVQGPIRTGIHMAEKPLIQEYFRRAVVQERAEKNLDKYFWPGKAQILGKLIVCNHISLPQMTLYIETMVPNALSKSGKVLCLEITSISSHAERDEAVEQ